MILPAIAARTPPSRRYPPEDDVDPASIISRTAGIFAKAIRLYSSFTRLYGSTPLVSRIRRCRSVVIRAGAWSKDACSMIFSDRRRILRPSSPFTPANSVVLTTCRKKQGRQASSVFTKAVPGQRQRPTSSSSGAVEISSLPPRESSRVFQPTLEPALPRSPL